MNIEDLSKICLSLESATQDIKWENDLCFSVGGKMFFVMSLDKVPTGASFKVSNEDFEELISKKNFKPAPYLGRYKWVYTDDVSLLSEKEWRAYIKKSYTLIFSKLPKKVRTELTAEK